MTEAGRGYRALLRIDVVRRLAIASVPSDFADWLDYTAVIALLVFSYEVGPWTMAVFTFTLLAPNLLVGPALAVYVDQWPLKRVLVLAHIGRALTTAYLMTTPPLVLVIAVAFLRGVVGSAFGPARQAAIQATTPNHLLGEANGLHQAIGQFSKIAGPTLGGMLLAVMAPQWVFGINASLSVVAALIILTIPFSRKTVAISAPEAFLRRLLAGFGEFRARRHLLQALIFAAVAFFAFFLYDALSALLIAELGMDASLFGIAVAAAGGGGLIGGLIGGRMPPTRPVLHMILAATLSGLVTVALALLAGSGFGVPAIGFVGAMLLMGGSTSFMMVPYRVLMQRDVDPSRIARVAATGESVITSVMIGAPFLGSLIASLWGVPAAFLAGGSVLLTLVAVTLATRRRSD